MAVFGLDSIVPPQCTRVIMMIIIVFSGSSGAGGVSRQRDREGDDVHSGSGVRTCHHAQQRLRGEGPDRAGQAGMQVV